MATSDVPVTGHSWPGPGQAEPQVSFPPPVRPTSAAPVSGTCDGLGWCVKRDAAPLGERHCNGAGRCVKGYAVAVGTTAERPVTAPLPPDPADVLTRLDELHKAASKAPWGLLGGTHDRDVIDDHGCHVAATGTFHDAAAIVAEHNAMPALLAAVRGVLALHVADNADWRQHPVCIGCRDECMYCEGDHEWPCPTVTAITAALEGAR